MNVRCETVGQPEGSKTYGITNEREEGCVLLFGDMLIHPGEGGVAVFVPVFSSVAALLVAEVAVSCGQLLEFHAPRVPPGVGGFQAPLIIITP